MFGREHKEKVERLEKLIARYFMTKNSAIAPQYGEEYFSGEVDRLELEIKEKNERFEIEAIVKDLLDRYKVKHTVPQD